MLSEGAISLCERGSSPGTPVLWPEQQSVLNTVEERAQNFSEFGYKLTSKNYLPLFIIKVKVFGGVPKSMGGEEWITNKQIVLEGDYFFAAFCTPVFSLPIPFPTDNTFLQCKGSLSCCQCSLILRYLSLDS